MSIGVALYPNHATDAPGLLRMADAAMYQAKRAGVGTWHVAQSLA
jgi:GGDEF domain-containing protein